MPAQPPCLVGTACRTWPPRHITDIAGVGFGGFAQSESRISARAAANSLGVLALFARCNHQLTRADYLTWNVGTV